MNKNWIVLFILLTAPFWTVQGEVDYSSFVNQQFDSSSPFNMKIIENPKIDPNSDQIINLLATNQAGESGFIIGVEGWTYPIYFPDANTPTYDVPLTEQYSDNDTLFNVPIPDGATPDPQDDGHLVIIDLQNRVEYDLWQARKVGDGWEASWGNSISLDSDGIYKYGFSARGSGFAASLGLVWPEEISNGAIEHALFFSIDDFAVKGGGPVRPATESDGVSDEQYALPEGGRIQLDPTLDLDSLGLTAAEKVIAKAMQEYGMILGDRGGGIQLYAARPNNYDWGTTFGDVDPVDGFAELFDGKISIKQFRVLQLGCQFESPIQPGQKLPEYRMYAQDDEVVNDCGDLGTPTGYADEGGSFEINFSFELAFFGILVAFPLIRKLKKNKV
ncbi:MAG: hypothetical protein D6732_00855 [Methanobacteriota archaeon]|nr:MAG: hypothetical protein D6732_00855 [Euryarchaeota archaeon]